MKHAAALLASGAPRLHVRHLVDHPNSMTTDQRRTRNIVAALKASQSGGIVALLGNRGCGKTQVAILIMANYLTKQLGRVRYATACEMFQSITESYSGRQATSWVTHGFTSPALLVIDDCHERRDTENEDRILMQVLDRRYREERGTILISNQKPEAFAKSMGPGITSRMWESGVVIELPAHDFRRAAGAKETDDAR